MFDKTITIFNRYHSRQGDTWYPHVIHNVQLTMDKASMVAKYGAESKDSASLIINTSNDMSIDGIAYLPPKKWSQLVNEELGEYITLNDNALYFDFFIVGEYPDKTPIVDDEYTDGFYNHMNIEYDYVYAITSVASYTLIPHFEVLAK